jgi:phosphoribosylaminoimidazolecarboxamide formyltransferase/IMP cyclohydrolase
MVKIHIKKAFGDFDAMFKKIHGKELSYNNLLDVDARNLIAEFKMMAQLCHLNTTTLAVATRTSISEAYAAALARSTHLLWRSFNFKYNN